MADLHILSAVGNSLKVVAHVPIPAANNVPGLSYQTAALRSGQALGTTILPLGDGTLGTIAQAEKDSIASGALVEEVTSIEIDGQHLAAMTAGVRNARLDAEFLRIKAAVQGRLQDALKYYGVTR